MRSWNKGYTKNTHPSVLKIAETLASKPKSNFWKWQQSHKPHYRSPVFCSELAELYGTMLGDGCIERFARCDKLTVSFNRKEKEHIAHVAGLLEKIFGKKPRRRVRKQSQCDDLYFYEKLISQRLNFPYGKKLQYKLQIPKWIQHDQEYLRCCLKGLFETDGNWAIDRQNHTNVIKLTSWSRDLLVDVFQCLCRLGYYPQRRKYDVRLAKHNEVMEFVGWIKFRQYRD